MKTIALYRHFDAAGQLLYVGLSGDPFKRLQAHMTAAVWRGAIANVTIENLQVSPKAALELEREAVAREKPLYNCTVHYRSGNAGRNLAIDQSGAVLTRARVAMGVTCYRVAKDTGVPYSTLRRLEAGTAHNLSAAHALALSKYFKRDLLKELLK